MRLFGNKHYVIWFFGLLAMSFVLVVSLFPQKPFDRVNTYIFDGYQRLSPRAWSGSDVLVVDIDEKSIAALGQWPWPRTVLADLVKRLGEMGAATIVFDVVFSEPDRTSPLRSVNSFREAGATVTLPANTEQLDHDTVFANAIAKQRVVTGLILNRNGLTAPPKPKAGTGIGGSIPSGFMQENMNSIRNIEIIDKASSGIGEFSFNTKQQQDAVVRKAPLMRGANGAFYPSLALEALRVAQGAGGFQIRTSDGSGEISGGEVRFVSAKVGALEIPIDATGAIDIYHSPSGQKPTLSVIDILNTGPREPGHDELVAQVANHLIFIGTSAAGLLDLRATPLEPVVPGVTIHAEIVDQIISGAFLSRPDFAVGAERFAAILVCLILLCLLPWLSVPSQISAALLLLVVVVAGAWFAFDIHLLLLSPALPVACLLATLAAGGAANLLITERQGRFVRQAFGRYLAPAMVQQLASDPASLKLGGEEKELTILFCDIRGFTGLSEGLGPTELTELLNNFLTPMTDALLKEGATIDKYMGDAIMAFWNAPLDQTDHRNAALRGMMAMRRELEELNRSIPRPIQVGIGLNTGSCCVGNLGSSQRFSYSAIGDTVNVASRIEGQTKQYGLDNLVADEVLTSNTSFAVLEVDRLGVVGRKEPLSVWTVLCGKTDLTQTAQQSLQALCTAHDQMLLEYRAGNADAAMEKINDCENLADRMTASGEIPSLTKLYELYRGRIEGYSATGFPENWDGVYRSTTK
ncbi:MAG: adenylate/guanylate cyclase domain-containing protein [Pseudomonadota bacterium]